MKGRIKMRVNIIGKGIIPLSGIGTLAPRYHIELTKKEIETLLGCQHLTVTDVATNLKITKLNIDSLFKPVNLPESKPNKMVNENTIVTPSPDVIVEDPIKEPVIDPPIDVTVEEPIKEVYVAKTERIGNAGDVDEMIEEKQSHPSHSNGKHNRKKNKHIRMD